MIDSMAAVKSRPQEPEKVLGPAGLLKARTGIRGLDEVTFGGLPQGRPTLVCGGPGCGKTLLGMEFLIRGATQFDEPGVCLSFEETAEELSRNVASLGFDVDRLIASNKLSIDYIFIERGLIEETGEYDLEALFLRLGYAVDSIGAKRVLLDSIEAVFAGLSNESLLRSELRRLFRWLKDKNLTAVITGERGEASLTRYGLEEYISDCVILLDNRVTDTVVTRRLRVVKYRGSTHGSNEYPFIIDNVGFSVLPVTSLELKHEASEDRISTGVPALDSMFGGKGYFRGSAVLISGRAGTGKTSLAAHFVSSACAKGEKCVYFSFEESANQVIRNMRSISVDLRRWINKGSLRFCATRPTTFGLEVHLVTIHSIIDEFRPDVVVVDPVTALLKAGTRNETQSMLLRLIDFLKAQQITTLMTALTAGDAPAEETDVNVSSLVDTWMLLRDLESGGERNRGLYVIKARGLAHSNQIREFLLTDHGVELRNVYLGMSGVLTGSARIAQEAQEVREMLQAQQEAERQRSLCERKRRAIEAQITALQAELEAETQEAKQFEDQANLRTKQRGQERIAMEQSRSRNTAISGNGRRDKPRGGGRQ